MRSALSFYLSSFLCWLLAATLSTAHELWIEPEAWQVPEGAEIRADLRNGENFEGSRLAWFDRNVHRADLAIGERSLQITGRIGDRPALAVSPFDTGLAILIHETTPSTITYQTWEKFQAFVDHKALPVTQDQHLAAGHALTGFTENYTRHTKALVAVGQGTGSDRAFGLQTEFVALANPYDANFNNILPVRLLYLGRPRAQAQIEIFARAPDGTVSVSTVTTDAQGEATIETAPGHSYLLDSVVLRAGSLGKAIYDTLWAGLSFHVPR